MWLPVCGLLLLLSFRGGSWAQTFFFFSCLPCRGWGPNRWGLCVMGNIACEYNYIVWNISVDQGLLICDCSWLVLMEWDIFCLAELFFLQAACIQGRIGSSHFWRHVQNGGNLVEKIFLLCDGSCRLLWCLALLHLPLPQSYCPGNARRDFCYRFIGVFLFFEWNLVLSDGGRH